MKNTEKLKSRYEKTTFQKLLNITMICLVTVVLLLFSLIVTRMSEDKIRQNVKDNMSVVVKQLDVYLGNYMPNIYNGFTSFESNQNLIQLRLSADDENYLSYTAASYLQVNKLLYQFLNANSDSVYNVYVNFNNGRVGTQAYEKDLLKISYKYDEWKTRFPENKYYWVNAAACRDLLPDENVGAVLFHLYEDINTGRNGITKTPDSEYIAYITGNQLRLYNTQTGENRLLHEEETMLMHNLSFSCDKKHIGFTRDEDVEALADGGPNYAGFKEKMFATKEGRVSVINLDGSGFRDVFRDTH